MKSRSLSKSQIRMSEILLPTEIMQIVFVKCGLGQPIQSSCCSRKTIDIDRATFYYTTLETEQNPTL